jgi:hypothetical protein
MNTRDFDLLGYKYSLLANVGTAGQNLVVCDVPARDAEEHAKFPAADWACVATFAHLCLSSDLVRQCTHDRATPRDG